MVDPDGAAHYYCCTHSSDGGFTWSTPVNVHSWSYGGARIAVDSAGNLFVVWTAGHVYSSVSTDKGLTWSQQIRVDDDTVPSECYGADPYVQPGTNDYLVVASVPYYHRDGFIARYDCLYRSTDMGRTFEPGFQLDTFGWGEPHVVADAEHIVCDYICKSELPDQEVTESRTYYAPSDTWGSRVLVTELDTPYVTYGDGSTLAISADGRVHTALYQGRHVRYTYSLDHGVSWSDPERVNEDTLYTGFPDIGADSDGHAYVVWAQGNSGCFRIWFATNNPLAIAEQPLQQPVGVQPIPTVARNVLFLPEATSPKPRAASLMDVSGRKVLDLKPGPNDISRLSPGVYFIKGQGSRGQGSEGSRVTKVVVTR